MNLSGLSDAHSYTLVGGMMVVPCIGAVLAVVVSTVPLRPELVVPILGLAARTTDRNAHTSEDDDISAKDGDVSGKDDDISI